MAGSPPAKRARSSPSTTSKATTPRPAPDFDPNAPATTEAFLNTLIQPLIRPPGRATKANTGVRVLPPGSTDNPKGNTIRYEDIDLTSLPVITRDELPVPLDDPRRKYASGITGVKLTHPGGALEGGPGADTALSDVQAEAPAGDANADADPDTVMRDDSSAVDLNARLPAPIREFLRTHDISSQEQLRDSVNQAKSKTIEELRKRMRERGNAVEKNRQLEEKIEELVAEREMERRVHERARNAREGGEA